ncbi:MAG: hypothetical protein ACLRXH_03160 [Monoglobus pectinilyticus]
MLELFEKGVKLTKRVRQRLTRRNRKLIY